MTHRLLALLTAALCALPVQAKLFVPDLEPWDVWVGSDESNAATIDHSAWQSVLDDYLVTGRDDGVHRFDYAGVSEAGRAELDTYIAGLTSLDPRAYALAEQQAYWINLYNALTVQLVLRYYPVKSIRKIEGGLLDTGPWDVPVTRVAGQTLTLNDIEHRILRPIWRDNRIHYAVNCASMGCPNLVAQAYTGANVDELLDAGARSFINHPRGVALTDGRLTVSSIYNWYDVDFGGDRQGLIQHLQQYAEPALAAQLANYTGKIRYDYDWQLNAR